MIFLYTFLVLILVIVIYLLFVPIVLYIDTTKNQYYLKLKGLVKASLKGHKDEILQLQLNILFFDFYFFPLKKSQKVNKSKKREKKSQKNSKIWMNYKTGFKVLRSFRVKRFLLDIDTGDCISNAKLYPFFALLNYKGGNFNINFDGRNRMVLCIENRPIYLIKSFLSN